MGVVKVIELKFSVFVILQISKFLANYQLLEVDESMLNFDILLAVLLLIPRDYFTGQLAFVFMKVLKCVEVKVLAMLVRKHREIRGLKRVLDIAVILLLICCLIARLLKEFVDLKFLGAENAREIVHQQLYVFYLIVVRKYLSKQDLDRLHGILVDSSFNACHTIEVLLNDKVARI